MRNTKELRGFLLDQMTGIVSGELEIDKAKGISNLAQQVYNTLNIEIKLASVKARLGDDVVVLPLEFDG